MRRFFTDFRPKFQLPIFGTVIFGLLVFLEEFSLYWAFLASMLGLILGVFAGLFIGVFYSPENEVGFTKSDFIFDINFLCYELMKSDGATSGKEQKYFERYLRKYFNIIAVKIILKHYKKIDLTHWSKQDSFRHIRQNYSFTTKKNLLYLLTGIALSDRYLFNKEKELLYDIARSIEAPELLMDKILEAFNYVSEEEQKQKYSNRRTSSNSRSTSNNLRFYKILHLTEQASTDEIKSSYRKLVKKYHPDRLVDATDVEKEIAKEEFQKIQDAYEYLKELKGF